MAEGSVSRKRKHVDEFVRHKATWSGLSEAALRKIYGFLVIRDSRGSRVDALNMGLACKSWSHIYPSSLEGFEYNITFKWLELKNYKIIEKYVQKFAHLFKSVTIEIPDTMEGSPFHNRLFYPWANHLNNIVGIINRINSDNLAVLNFAKIYMSEMREFGRNENEAGVVEVVDLVSEEEEEAAEAGAVEAGDSAFGDEALKLVESSIHNLISNKKNLQKLIMYNLGLDYQACIRLFKVICRCPSIRELSLLGLIDYFSVPPDEPEEEQCLPELLEKLPLLSTLRINHRLILGKNANPSEVCTMLAQHQRELRVEIMTVANYNSNSYKTFTTDDWNTLKGNKKLEVGIIFHTYSKYKSEMEKIFLPGAPIFCITHTFNENENFGINDLFTYLDSRNPTENIIRMKLEFKASVTDLVSTLKPRLEKCKNLNLLRLIFVHPVEDLELFLNKLIPVLPYRFRFKVTVTRINSKSELSRLEKVASDFKNRFKSKIYFYTLFQEM